VKNKITSQMRAEVLDFLEHHGPCANPLLILLNLATSEEVSRAVREKAAHDAAKYLIPSQRLIENIPNEEEGGNSGLVIQALRTLLNPAPPKLIEPSTEETEQ
jgi:hypothetical protein